MNYFDFVSGENEKPLEKFPADGGLCSIFRTIGCIGDSLASGEFESTNEKGEKGYHDYFEYSWGQYLARQIGSKAYNFSRGGMTAKEYWDSFAESNHFWDEDKLCQAYIIALGVNDLCGQKQEIGSVADIDRENYDNNKETFLGYYAKIIQRLKKMQPKARFFLVSMPRENNDEGDTLSKKHCEALKSLTEFFDYTYLINLTDYAPAYDSEFKKRFYLGGHMNPSGYVLTARMIGAYIDYIIRNKPEDFAQVGFIGKGVHNRTAKW